MFCIWLAYMYLWRFALVILPKERCKFDVESSNFFERRLTHTIQMTAEEIGKKINGAFPNVYAPTTYPTELMMVDGTSKVGYFAHTEDSADLAAKNIFTFVEFGENAQRFRATGEKKYVSFIHGDSLFNVIYPAKSPILADRINQLKIKWGKQGEQFWIQYREDWKKSILELSSQIVYKWLLREEEKGILKSEFINISKADAYLGQYIITRLEITFQTGGLIVLDPVASITSEYDGRADLFGLGDISKRVVFLRQYIDSKKMEWLVAISSNRQEDMPLNEISFKSILQRWGYLS